MTNKARTFFLLLFSTAFVLSCKSELVDPNVFKEVQCMTADSTILINGQIHEKYVYEYDENYNRVKSEITRLYEEIPYTIITANTYESNVLIRSTISSNDTIKQKTSYIYNEQGKLKETQTVGEYLINSNTWDNSINTLKEFDDFGNVILETSVSANSSLPIIYKYSYTEDNQISSESIIYGSQTSYYASNSYNSYGLLLEKYHSGVRTYNRDKNYYNEKNQLTGQSSSRLWSPLGKTGVVYDSTSYAYNEKDLLVSKIHNSYSAGPGSSGITYSSFNYNKNEQLINTYQSCNNLDFYLSSEIDYYETGEIKKHSFYSPVNDYDTGTCGKKSTFSFSKEYDIQGRITHDYRGSHTYLVNEVCF